MSGHLDHDALADLQEGLLAADQAEAARRHLAACQQCSATQTALDEVRTLLSGAPDPGPMPERVAARIDAALTVGSAVTGPAGPAESAVTVLASERSRRRLARSTGILQAAAAIVLLLALGAVAVSFVRGGAGGGAADTAAPGGAGQALDRRGTEAGSYPVLATGTDYTEQSVEAAVPRLLGAPPTNVGKSYHGQPETATGSARAYRLTGGPALAGCVAELAGGPAVPLAVDVARYQGEPATVIVLPTPGDPTTVDVWVVAPGCAQGDARMLLFRRVHRP